jgi:hypothetical protein
MMNVKLLGTSALLVQSGTLLVSPTVIVLSTFLQSSNFKPAKVCSAQAGRQGISTALAAPQREL